MIVSLSFSFVKTIKTKSGIRLNLFLHLALPILHQPLRRYLSKGQNRKIKSGKNTQPLQPKISLLMAEISVDK
jgi:hypothetical protein